MSVGPGLLLIGAVFAVGVLHTIVPDHWVPIVLLARQRGWSKTETARVALQAGTGHVLSTLLIALVVWLAGVAAATRFGDAVDTAASLALILFGGWIGLSAWRELAAEREQGHSHASAFAAHDHNDVHDHDHDHGHRHDDDHAPEPEADPLYAPLRGEARVFTHHAHSHRHRRGAAHIHWHDHVAATAHPVTAALAMEPPLHWHRHKTTARTALLLILGSSPMVEGIPAFFAAGKYGVGLIAAMAAVFALSTIATYVLLCVVSAAGLERVRLGAVERYGEVLSGALIALVGLVFWLWPVL